MGLRILLYFNSYIKIKYSIYIFNTFHGFGFQKLRLFYLHIKFSLKRITNHKVEKDLVLRVVFIKFLRSVIVIHKYYVFSRPTAFFYHTKYGPCRIINKEVVSCFSLRVGDSSFKLIHIYYFLFGMMFSTSLLLITLFFHGIIDVLLSVGYCYSIVKLEAKTGLAREAYLQYFIIIIKSN